MGQPPHPRVHSNTQALHSSKEIFNQEQVYIHIGDRYEEIRGQVNFSLLDPSVSQDQDSLLRLALITAFQYAEFIPDHMAVEAMLKRMDWKYALHLPVKFAEIPATSLSSFRETTFYSKQAACEYGKLLQRLGEIGLYNRDTLKYLNGVAVISTICMINQYDHLNQAMKDALAYLVVAHPDWLRQNVLPYWYARYKTGPRMHIEKRCADSIREDAVRIGKDIQYLLTAIQEQNLIGWADQAEIQVIAHLWNEQFTVSGDQLRWQPIIGSNRPPIFRD